MPPTPRDGWWEPYLDTSYRDLCDAAHAAAGWQRRTTEGATPQGAARFTTGHVFPSMLAAPILGGHDGHHRTPGHGPAPAPAPAPVPPPDLPAVALAVPPAPMGRAAARGGPARGVLCAHRSRAEPAPRAGSVRAHALARVVAAVPPDVPLRNHKARERRPDVARPHRPRLPLLEPAPAAVDGVVRPLAPGMDAPRHAASRSRGGAGRAVAHLRPRAARPAAARGLRLARARAARHCRHRQLRVLQRARARAVRAARRRRA